MPVQEPNLRKLAEGYFHQDYDLEAPTPDGVVRNFVADHPQITVDRVAEQVAALLAAHPTEAEFEELWIERYQSSFEPETIGLTYRQWFERMLEILRAG